MITMLLSATKNGSTVAGWVEPWSSLYSDSKGVSAAVLFLHLVPLVVAAGTAWVADRGTLRAARGTADDRARQLGELGGLHRFVIGGLALSLTSGGLLFLSDVDTFWTSPFFWIKMGCVALLLVNGFLMTRTEAALATQPANEASWTRMRSHALASGALWLATVLAGVLLLTYA